MILFSCNIASALELNHWLSPELRRLQSLQHELANELHELGPINMGQTTQQMGAQHIMAAVPPPQSPWIQLDFGETQAFDSITLVPVILNFESTERTAYAFPAQFRIDASDDPTFKEFHSLYRSSDESGRAIGGLPLTIQTPAQHARFVRVTVTELANVEGRWTFALAEIMVLSGNRNVALSATVSGRDFPSLEPFWNLAYVNDGRTPLGPPIIGDRAQFDGLFSVPQKPDAENWMMIDLGSKYAIDEIRLHPVHSWQGVDFPGYAFPLRMSIEVSSDDAFNESTTVFRSDKPLANPGNNPVTIQTKGVTCRYVRVKCVESSRPQNANFGLSEIEVYSDNRNVAKGCTASVSGDFKERPVSMLVDGYTSYGRLIELPEWLERFSRIRNIRIQQSDIVHQKALAEIVVQRRWSWFLLLSGSGLLALAVGLIAFRIRKRRREQELFRLQLARDLHDEIGSNLAAISTLGEVAGLESDTVDHRRDWEAVQKMATECTEAMQETLWLLGGRRSPTEDIFGRLRKVSQRMLTGVEITWHQQADVDELQLDATTHRELFLSVKELLANVAKHARADSLKVDISYDRKSLLQITFADNGSGFSKSTYQPGMGLSNVRQRIQKLGGSIDIRSDTTIGTEIRISVPVQKSRRRSS